MKNAKIQLKIQSIELAILQIGDKNQAWIKTRTISLFDAEESISILIDSWTLSRHITLRFQARRVKDLAKIDLDLDRSRFVIWIGIRR